MLNLEQFLKEPPQSGYLFVLKSSGRPTYKQQLYEFLSHFPYDACANIDERNNDQFVLITEWNQLRDILTEYIFPEYGFDHKEYSFPTGESFKTAFVVFLREPYKGDNPLPDSILELANGYIWVVNGNTTELPKDVITHYKREHLCMYPAE